MKNKFKKTTKLSLLAASSIYGGAPAGRYSTMMSALDTGVKSIIKKDNRFKLVKQGV